ncbi:MAG: inositol monophosphatase [Polyangiaceae bacterium]|nr:inositol monophosphatase [Polyangiaceae bacterium]
MDRAAVIHALAVARKVASDLEPLLMEGFRSGTRIEKKGTIDLVTEYDRRAEAKIRTELLAAFPDHRIVGEEAPPEGEGERVWYVDPIDGTTNFAHGHPFFGVSLALYEGAVPLVGVVAAPALGITWWAARGEGAYRNGERSTVSANARLEDCLCSTGFPYDQWTSAEDNLREHRAFLAATQGVRRCGAAALDLCFVSDGSYDLYWEQKLQPWDVAAGALMVVEAGGTISDYDGTPVDARGGRLVATNGHVHEETIATLREARSR